MCTQVFNQSYFTAMYVMFNSSSTAHSSCYKELSYT